MEEKELPLLSEEEREARILQEYKYQLDLLELVRTFLLMGYEHIEIFTAIKSLGNTVSETQIDFYCEYVNDRRDKDIREINDSLFRFLWEIEPPKLPEEPESEKPDTRKPVEKYLCKTIILNLLKDRIDYLRSVINAGCFEMSHFIAVGYDTHYVEVMKEILEEYPKMHSRDVAKLAYQTLYREEKHEEGFIFSIDKLDVLGMITACRERWQNTRKKIERGEE